MTELKSIQILGTQFTFITEDVYKYLDILTSKLNFMT